MSSNADQKLAALQEAAQPGMTISYVPYERRREGQEDLGE
jgi:hypothetical protein